MKNSKMKKQQTNIIILTAVIFLFMVGKYTFAPVILPISFFMFELISAITLLFLLYYTERTITALKLKETQLNNHIQSLSSTAEHLKGELEKKNSAAVNEFDTGNTIENIDELFKNIPTTKSDSEFYNSILSVLSENFEIVIALFFTYNEQSQSFSVEGNYGIQKDEPIAPFVIGEGVHGEALKEKKVTVLDDLPEEYFVGYSGLGEAKPKHLYLLPVADEDNTIGIIEMASFKPLGLEEVWDRVNRKLIELITAR